MPTIDTYPAAVTVEDADVLPLKQLGVDNILRRVSIGQIKAEARAAATANAAAAAAAQATANAALPEAGGTMTGPIVLSADPSTNLQAATKQYVDNAGRIQTSAIAANGTIGTLPINAKLRSVYISNTTNNAVTGGVNIGTVSGGSDIALAVTVNNNGAVDGGLTALIQAALLRIWFSTSATQQIFISAVTSWNGASLNITMEYDS